MVLGVGCAQGRKEISDRSYSLENDLQKIEVSVVPGEHYLHEFPLFLFISLHNPPQMVLWAETIDGHYIDTLMVTRKIGGKTWAKAPKDPVGKDQIKRPEALPVWEWKKEMSASQGLPLPEKDNALTDAITHASPKSDFSVKSNITNNEEEIYLYFEVNHSTDFNDAYPSDVKIGQENYNGGVMGSGQPALVYRAYVNFSIPELSSKTFELIGHSSPSGKDGNIYTDMQGIDSALSIIDSVILAVH